MRELSTQARSLLDRARHKPSRFARLLRSTEPDFEAALRELSALGEPAAIPELLSLVVTDARSLSRPAATACARILSGLPQLDLPDLDQRLRERSTWWGGWWSLEPEDLSRFSACPESAAELTLLATCHPNGFVREKAIREVAATTTAGVIPFLLVRRNDWVQQVRAVASDALTEMLTPERAREFVGALPLVYRIGAYTRADHGAFIRAVESLLRQPDCWEALLEGTHSDDRYVRRDCFGLAFRTEQADQLPLIESALADADPMVRLLGATAAAGDRSTATNALLDAMEKDPFGRVRQTGLEARARLFPEQAEAAYRRHLMDRSMSIRRQSQKALQSIGKDPAPSYRSAIASRGGPTLHVALIGLAEIGADTDADLPIPFLKHEFPRVRAAALRALARLRHGDLTVELVEAIADGAPRVSREARNLFLAGRGNVTSERLWDILQDASDLYIALNALATAQSLSRWERLQFFLRAVAEGPDQIAERAEALVDRWLMLSNRAALSPTESDLDATRERLDAARGSLQEKVHEELRFSIASFTSHERSARSDQ